MSDAGAGAAPATVPVGAKDVLPVEAQELRAIERAWRSCVEGCGYREVMTPVLEFAGVVDRAQEGVAAEAFRLFDETGRVMVLRPDLTIPVARLIATRMADHPGPVRVAYLASAFRPPRPGRPRATEQRQAGVELVGATEPGADAEVIALLVRSLVATGLSGVRVSVADVSLTRAVMDALGVSEDGRAQLGAALAGRDLIGWSRYVTATLPPGPAADLLADLPGLRGDISLLDRVEAAVPAAGRACARLRDTLGLAREHGVGDEVGIDLGVLRDWSYYSGVVFEAYAEGAAEPLAMGGRYDGLAGRFGRARPAVGFAIALDQLHRALLAHGVDGAAPRPGVVVVGALDRDPAAAGAARAAGVVVIALAAADDARAEALAEVDNWRYVARPADGGYDVLDRASGRRLRWSDLEEALA